MGADVEIVRDRESRIRQYVADLRQMAAITKAAFLENRERQYAVLHALQLAIDDHRLSTTTLPPLMTTRALSRFQ